MRLDERENVAMNLDVNLRHFLEVPKDLATKSKRWGKEAVKGGC